jgi:hypothetical protein
MTMTTYRYYELLLFVTLHAAAWGQNRVVLPMELTRTRSPTQEDISLEFSTIRISLLPLGVLCTVWSEAKNSVGYNLLD